MKHPKYFICPMSKNITDAVISMESDEFGLLPTRRQIDFDGGYVNGWSTYDFHKYVRSKSGIILERDHSGAKQGVENDNGYDTFTVDANLFDIIHIDPWKLHSDKTAGAMETMRNIDYIYGINPKVKFEIGTEQDIMKFTPIELIKFLSFLHRTLSTELWDTIEYVVVQSGVSLDLVNKTNKGVFDEDRFTQMVAAVNMFGKKAKEHNGDYLTDREYRYRFECGLTSINIGPELAQLETSVYLDNMTEEQIDNFYSICLLSGRWKRWVPGDVLALDKRKLIEVCGHYSYSEYDYRYGLPQIDDKIQSKITEKLNSLLNV